jgi:hypothetical protein
MCIWCPIEDIKEKVAGGRKYFGDIINYLGDLGDDDGITFLELTEDSLRNLPPFMVRNMECFNQENIDTSVYSVKELKFPAETLNTVIDFFEGHMAGITEIGFTSEIVIARENKIEEENIGKTVCKKGYELCYHKSFK